MIEGGGVLMGNTDYRHTRVYHTPPTESSCNHMGYEEDDDNGETGEEDIRNVESDEKERVGSFC